MSKIDFQDGGCGSHLGFSISSFSYFMSTRRPNAHHRVSIHLVYRRDVQNMNSQHFSHSNAWGSKSELAVKRSNLHVNEGPSF